ncbi:MAG: hypothetical protein ACK551_03345 [Vampirovibrionales bacterium]
MNEKVVLFSSFSLAPLATRWTSAKSLGDSQFAHPLGFSAWTSARATV